jgi:hypothetical protein
MKSSRRSKKSEFFSNSNPQVEQRAEFVRLTFQSEQTHVSVILTPTAYHALARAIVAGPLMLMH